MNDGQASTVAGRGGMAVAGSALLATGSVVISLAGDTGVANEVSVAIGLTSYARTVARISAGSWS
jgi:hypothetical protein